MLTSIIVSANQCLLPLLFTRTNAYFQYCFREPMLTSSILSANQCLLSLLFPRTNANFHYCCREPMLTSIIVSANQCLLPLLFPQTNVYFQYCFREPMLTSIIVWIETATIHTWYIFPSIRGTFVTFLVVLTVGIFPSNVMIICELDNHSGYGKLFFLTSTTVIIIHRTVSWNIAVPVIYLSWQLARIVMQYFWQDASV